MAAVSLLVIGAGGRGAGYANYALSCPEQARVVGVAEPRDFHREKLAAAHAIPPRQIFSDWRAAARRPRFADAVLICTQDRMHLAPALAFARRGYHILLEKPMAPSAADCRKIVRAAQQAGVIFAVCHVLRYTAYTRALKALLDAGTIGEIVDIQLLEPVAYWHQAHSFVRGNWRNEAESSPMLLAKCCHDIDWLRHIAGQPCLRVSSFGSLRHFRKACQPAGAADRCVACAIEANCPYSAVRLYGRQLQEGRQGWPLCVVDPLMTAETLRAALSDGPYGRCVYACDNDVVDHQVVNLEYAGGLTASLTMTAFTPSLGRQVRIGGTRGYIEGDSATIRHYDYLTEQWQTHDTRTGDTSILGGHGGGDGGLMQAFLKAVADHDPSAILSGPEETLETHLTVFAAERARRLNRVVTLD